MTLLQKVVIQRLRAAGYNTVADAAKDCWSHGEPVATLTNVIAEGDAELQADFTKANQQASSS